MERPAPHAEHSMSPLSRARYDIIERHCQQFFGGTDNLEDAQALVRYVEISAVVESSLQAFLERQLLKPHSSDDITMVVQAVLEHFRPPAFATVSGGGQEEYIRPEDIASLVNGTVYFCQRNNLMDTDK